MNINSVGQYQVNFNGYVDKSVIKFVKITANSEIKNKVNIANSLYKRVDSNEIKDIHKESINIIDKLKTFMDVLHPDTNLKLIGDYPFGKALVFGNNKLKNLQLRFIKSANSEETINNGRINIDLPKLESASVFSLSKFADDLLKLKNPKEIDSTMFERYKTSLKFSYSYMNNNFIERFFAIQKAKKADKMAAEFGQKADVTDALNKHFSALEDLRIQKQNIKNLKKENDKIVKDILKNS